MLRFPGNSKIGLEGKLIFELSFEEWEGFFYKSDQKVEENLI